MNLKKEITEIHEWLLLEEKKKTFSEQFVSRLTELLDDDVPVENASRLASRLSTVAILWGNQFLYDLTRNKESSIQHGSSVVESKFLSQAIIITAIDHREGSGRVFAKDLHLTFLLLLSFGRWGQAEWLGRRIYEGDTIERFNGAQPECALREVSEWEALGGDVTGFGAIVAGIRRLIPGQREKEGSAGRLDSEPAFPYWEDNPLCGLVLRLWLIMTEKAESNSFPDGLPSCGPYSPLFKNWKDEEKLSQSIVEACDYHLSRTEENSANQYGIPEFEMRPYNVLPVEILSLRTIRRQSGLSTPWPDHELLSSPFVNNLPKTLPPSGNELIQRVYKAVEGVFPDIKKIAAMH